jgi:GNAT superfamily N-acetyltransferase
VDPPSASDRPPVAERRGPISLVPAEVVRPLRQSVLRPGLPPGESVYDGDDHPLAAHAALSSTAPGGPGVEEPSGAGVLAVGSLFPEDPPAWIAEHVAAASRPGLGATSEPAGAAGDATSEPGGSAGGTTTWWRIRGMATAYGHRGQGLGRAVLETLLATAAERGNGLVWCNARVPAVSFYLRAGFHPVGEVFDVPLIGAHRAMWRAVAAGWDTDHPVQVSEDPPHPQGAVHA